MIVLTADQRESTKHGDHVPAVLDLLSTRARGRPGVVLPFDRTVGDEVQGVLEATEDGAALAVDLVLDLVRDGGWSVGLGLGAVDEPLPEVSRAASGPAFTRARAAVERAKRRGAAVPVAVVGPSQEPWTTVAADAEAALRLLGAVVARRSGPGWEAVDSLASHGVESAPQRAAATALGVSEQAVSQRLRAALWAEEQAVRPLVARLLRAGGAAERIEAAEADRAEADEGADE